MIRSKKRKINKNNIIIFLLLLFLLLPVENIYSQKRRTIKKNLKKILNQDKYIYHKHIKSKYISKKELGLFNWVDKVFRKIFDIIVKIFKVSSYFSIIIYIAFLVLIVYLIFLIIKKSGLLFDKTKPIDKEEQLYDQYNLDYQKELSFAEELMNRKKYKEAISILLNSLWLFYHYHKVIYFNKSITNREYIKKIQSIEEYNLIKNIVFSAEKSVYAEDTISVKDCKKIFSNVNKIISG